MTRPAVRRAAIETLEDRRLFTVFTVTTVSSSTATDGQVSFAEAIAAANTNAAVGDAKAGQGSGVVDTINFAIPGTGLKTIGGTNVVITEAVTINGTTQNAFVNDTGKLIQIATGVQVKGSGSTLQGLILGGNFKAVSLDGNHNTLKECYVGVDADSFTPLPDATAALHLGGDYNQVLNSVINAAAGGAAAVSITGAHGTLSGNDIGLFNDGNYQQVIGIATDVGSNINLISGNSIRASRYGMLIASAKSTTIQSNNVDIHSNIVNNIVAAPEDIRPAGVTVVGSTLTLVGGKADETWAMNSFSGDGVGVASTPHGSTNDSTTILGNSYDPESINTPIDIHPAGGTLSPNGDGPTANDTPDADNIVNAPTLTNAVYSGNADAGYTFKVVGTFSGKPNQSYLIETTFYGEGVGFVYGTVKTDAQGLATFIHTGPAGSEPRDLTDVYATATLLSGSRRGDTSEISNVIQYTVAEVVKPVLTVADVTVAEGNSGSKLVTFTATLDAPATKALTVHYNTQIDPGDSLLSQSDILFASGDLAFAVGDKSKTFTITVFGDTTVEPDESAHIHFTSPGIAAEVIAKLTVTNDDSVTPPPTLFNIKGFLWSESDGDAVYEPGSLTDLYAANKTVFIDTNGNSKLDAGEKSVQSDAQGNYTIPNLPIGSYRVTRVLPSDYKFSFPTIGYTIVNVSGADVTGINFASTPKTTTPPPPTTASIKGMLFYDVNKNGKIDGTGNTADVAQPGKVVFIDTDGDGVLDTNETKMTSAADGSFTFTGLKPGTYKIRRVLPKGYVYTTPARNITVKAGDAILGVLIGTGLA